VTGRDVGDKAREWDRRIASFAEANQSLLEEPTLGLTAAHRLHTETLNLLVSLMNEVTELGNQTTGAANQLADATNTPHTSAGAIHRKERHYYQLKAEHEQLLAIQQCLQTFETRVRVAIEKAGQTTPVENSPERSRFPWPFRRRM
jgi:hypothetical protein